MVFYDYTNKNTLEVYRDMCYVIYKNQGRTRQIQTIQEQEPYSKCGYLWV